MLFYICAFFLLFLAVVFYNKTAQPPVFTCNTGTCESSNCYLCSKRRNYEIARWLYNRERQIQNDIADRGDTSNLCYALNGFARLSAFKEAYEEAKAAAIEAIKEYYRDP
jgi:hypothetical protein